MSIFTRVFWKDAVERSLRTGAQNIAATWSAAGVGSLIGVDWKAAASIAGFGILYSLVTSVAAGALTNTEGASLVVEAVDPPGKHAAD
ncbi:holin [Nakamurella leprariae]|uniref:Holin n=1 Tax=Nakamurella leprariae TaxID=2803911 RepID=A0A939C1L8_9ACTN|nr:holin [Nakamurella leprariae]MBM9467277.1 hypothetical protein [Nakamurella leprariae]